MRLAHLRTRRWLALLASNALEEPRRSRLLDHVAGCARCREELSTLHETLALAAADPIRQLSPPIGAAALATRVRAQLEDTRSARLRGPRFGSWVPLGVGAAAVAATLVAVWPLRPVPHSVGQAPEVLISDDSLRRLERTMARERAARYLTEAQDVLVTVAARPTPCHRGTTTVDVDEASARSRDLLARRALAVDPDGEHVASAAPVLNEVEEALREVAALESCARPLDLERLRAQVEGRHLLMRMRLVTRELEG
jgi:hypothetical protein